MFKIIPSLSVSEGKLVKAKRGDIANALQYNYSPVDLAKLFEDHGMTTLQLIDLDGAKKESPVNYHVLEAITGHTDIKVDFAGGIRTDGDINKVFEYGATYFTASSISVSNKDLFTSWIFSYGREKVGLSADSIDNKIRISAWRKETEVDLFEHIRYFYDRGLKYVKITDISRDGCLDGPNFELYREAAEQFPNACLSASGGVRSVDDIIQLKEAGVYGVIIGRALYEGRLKLKEIEKWALVE